MRWTGVIVHHTASDDSVGVDTKKHRDYHVKERGWRDLGYHFVCELVGGEYEVVAGRPLNMSGAHCPGKNSTHIGFALVGNFSHDPPKPEHLGAAARFLAGLLDALEIDTSEIDAHRDHKATECPGSKFSLKSFREIVDRYRQ